MLEKWSHVDYPCFYSTLVRLKEYREKSLNLIISITFLFHIGAIKREYVSVLYKDGECMFLFHIGAIKSWFRFLC